MRAIVITLGLIICSAPILAANEVPPQQSTSYDPDPNHPWNQLNSALFARAAPNGTTYGLDELDILYWYYTEHLLTEPSHTKALQALDRFIKDHQDRLIRDPVKRVLLQRNLWALFDWSAMPGQTRFMPERVELQARLAVVIHRVALDADEIAGLPDNYADVIKSGQLPELPRGLFDTAGPWVAVGNHGQPVARLHTAAPSYSGRSLFLVMAQLPEGRPQTLNYLQTLHTYEGPIVGAPQFPAGTAWALVRRLCIIDDQGRIQPTSLIESIQIRRYLAVPTGRADPEREMQFMEFDLDPRHAANLRQVAPGERDFMLFFQGRGDPFESNTELLPLEFRPETLRHCMMCHRAPGILSVNSYHENIGQKVGNIQHLEDSTVERETTRGVPWKYHQLDWRLLEAVSRSQH
jgi:hypothetical protein